MSTWGLRFIAALAVVGLVLWGLDRGVAALIEHGRVQERIEARDQADELLRHAGKAAEAQAIAARDEAAQLRTVRDRLLRELRNGRTALVVAGPDPRDAGGDARGAGPGLRAPAVPGEAAAPADAAPPGGGAPRVLRLTAGAVGMWNAALQGGGDAAAACGASAAAAAACAAATDVTLDDAWANHIENAARCAEDRARHQRLINAVQALQPAGGLPVHP